MECPATNVIVFFLGLPKHTMCSFFIFGRYVSLTQEGLEVGVFSIQDIVSFRSVLLSAFEGSDRFQHFARAGVVERRLTSNLATSLFMGGSMDVEQGGADQSRQSGSVVPFGPSGPPGTDILKVKCQVSTCKIMVFRTSTTKFLVGNCHVMLMSYHDTRIEFTAGDTIQSSNHCQIEDPDPLWGALQQPRCNDAAGEQIKEFQRIAT